MTPDNTTERVFYDVEQELRGSRRKFPSNEHMMAALTEEVGELAQALIDHSRGKAAPSQIYTEAVQVASMAIRLAQEGSAEFPYVWDYSHYQFFKPTAE